MQKLVTEGVKLMGELGFVPQQQILQGEQKRLAREKYKVAVIGQFKVGKSTLINKVFLRDNVLFTDLTEATAFPTEIEFGRPARLEVFPSTYAGLPSAQKTDSSAPLPAGEGSPHVIEEPNPEQIKAHTSADGDEARAQMARQTSRVRLLWPADSLKGLTVVDTPGINTPNEAVASTTYRVIPDADVAVFLTRAQQLSQTDIAFLRSRVFEQGISRCLAVVNYDRNYQDLSEAALKNLVAAIEAQLANIGREHVPVVRLNMRTKPGLRNLGESIVSALTGKAARGEKDSLAAFEQTLLEFIRTNALPGRMARAQALLRRELEKAKLECQVELNSLRKTEAEKAEIKQKIEREYEAYHARYLKLGEKFLEDLHLIQRLHLKGIQDGLNEVTDRYVTKFDSCAGLTDVQKLLQRAQVEFQPDVEAIMFAVSAETRTKIEALEARYQATLQEAAEPWVRTVVDELKIDGGFLAKVPSWLVWAGDIILSCWLLPGGPLIDITLRLIASKIPGLRDILPTKVLTKFLISKAKKSIQDQVGAIQSCIRQQLDSSFAEAEKKIQASWEANGKEQLQTIIAPLERAMEEDRDPKRAQALKSGVQRIDDPLARTV